MKLAGRRISNTRIGAYKHSAGPAGDGYQRQGDVDLFGAKIVMQIMLGDLHRHLNV